MRLTPAGSRIPPTASAVPEVEVLQKHQESSAWSIFFRIGYRFRGIDGRWVHQEREFLDRGDAVALLPYCPETGNVLLTRQFRMPVYLRHPEESLLVECCGGILDDPDPAVTARHEAIEELGIELGPLEKVFEGYSTPGSVCEKVHYFVAPYSQAQRRHAGGGNAHEGEDIEVLEMPLAEALRQVRTGEIRDVRTIALLLFLGAFPPVVAHAASDA
jgi:nudix-type nucleoside diphosphatase (YffH/AdpP family)